MCMSENKILRLCFDKEELSDKKRPETVRPVSACLCLCVPAFLSHSTTNRGVFPSVMVSVWSAGSHSLKNALTLVCPSHTHTHTKPPVLHTGPSVLDWAGQPLLVQILSGHRLCFCSLTSSSSFVFFFSSSNLHLFIPFSPLSVSHRLLRLPQAATQFKASLAKLMEILMSKEPSYVRCIKPNDSKQAGTKSTLARRNSHKSLMGR